MRPLLTRIHWSTWSAQWILQVNGRTIGVYATRTDAERAAEEYAREA